MLRHLVRNKFVSHHTSNNLFRCTGKMNNRLNQKVFYTTNTSFSGSAVPPEVNKICKELIENLNKVEVENKALEGEKIQEPELENLYTTFSKRLEQQQEVACNVPKANPCDVFTNGELRLDQLKVLGFDYDYTLASYTTSLEELIYDKALKYFLSSSGYPSELLKCKYDPNFAIRGLLFDTLKGVLLKMDSLNLIQHDAAYYGREQMSQKAIDEAYPAGNVAKEYLLKHMRTMSDIFCLPEACLIADVIQFMKSHDIEFDPVYVYDDIKKAVEFVHDSGVIDEAVAANPSRFVIKRPDLVNFLSRMRDNGKKLFIATNSNFPFINVGMQYAMPKDTLPPGVSDWTDLFDLVLVNCKKPRFFTSSRPFRKYDKEANLIMWHRVTGLKKGEIYVHGSVKQLVAATGWKGRDILYFGDHVYNDMKEPQQRAGWRTGVIVSELENEVKVMNTPEFRKALVSLIEVEHALVVCMKSSSKSSVNVRNVLQHTRKRLRTTLKKEFNPHFGSVFRTHKNATQFGFQIQGGANVYTSKLENLLQYPPHFTFLPPRMALPHEPVIPGSHQ